MEKSAKVFVAGHEGMIGSAVLRRLDKDGFKNLLIRATLGLDLLDQAAVSDFFKSEKPDYVFLTAAKMGGIQANSTHPAEFIYDNIQLQTNVIHSAWKWGVKKLLYWGSTCIYPRECPQPMKEEYMLTGPLEPTSGPYSVAKIAGITMCQAYNAQYGTKYIAVVPATLYGPNDSFDADNSHVLTALIRRFHEAKIAGAGQIVIWGTGSPKREFLHVDDMADACLLLMDSYGDSKIINVGTGEDLPIKELAEIIKEVVGFEGKIMFDTSRPDGAPRKLLDSSRIQGMGWSPKVALRDGIRQTYDWFKEYKAKAKQG